MFDGATSFKQDLTSWPDIAQNADNFCTSAVCGNVPSQSDSNPPSISPDLPPSASSTSYNWNCRLFVGFALSSCILSLL